MNTSNTNTSTSTSTFIDNRGKLHFEDGTTIAFILHFFMYGC